MFHLTVGFELLQTPTNERLLWPPKKNLVMVISSWWWPHHVHPQERWCLCLRGKIWYQLLEDQMRRWPLVSDRTERVRHIWHLGIKY